MFWSTAAYAMAGAPQGAEGGAGGFLSFMPLILMFAIFYFLLIRPQQKRAKEHKMMLSALKRGDRVVTAGGIYGRILELDDTTVTLDLGNSTVTVGRGFITSLVTNGPKMPVEQPKGKKDKGKEQTANTLVTGKTEEKAPAEAAGTNTPSSEPSEKQ